MVDEAQKARPHVIHDRTVEPKRAIPREVKLDDGIVVNRFGLVYIWLNEEDELIATDCKKELREFKKIAFLDRRKPFSGRWKICSIRSIEFRLIQVAVCVDRR